MVNVWVVNVLQSEKATTNIVRLILTLATEGLLKPKVKSNANNKSKIQDASRVEIQNIDCKQSRNTKYKMQAQQRYKI